MRQTFIISKAEEISPQIEACREAGGGILVFRPGKYEVASIRLYSNMKVIFQKGVRILGSENWRDYTNYQVPTTLGYVHSKRIQKKWNIPEDHYVNAIFTAFEEENIELCGEEDVIIDGRDCYDPNGEEGFRGPMGMVFCKCKNIRFFGYQLQNAGNWAHQFDSCVNVEFCKVKVLAGHDGINIHHCKNVWIHDCFFQTGDDCVAGYDTENVIVEHCYMNTSCNGFRIGGVHLWVRHVTMEGDGLYPHRISQRHNMLYGFDFYSLEDDMISRISENWLIEDCRFQNMKGLLYYHMGDESENQTNLPLRDVIFRRCEARDLKEDSVFISTEDCASSLTLEDCHFYQQEKEVSFSCEVGENCSMTINGKKYLKKE